MRFLYVIFILSTAALLWAAYAISRTVRRHGRGGGHRSMLSLRSDPLESSDSSRERNRDDEPSNR